MLRLFKKRRLGKNDASLSQEKIGFSEPQNIFSLRPDNDSFSVEFDLVKVDNRLQNKNKNLRTELMSELEYIDARIDKNNAKICDLIEEEHRLTNYADTLDYTVAVASGILAGTVDTLLVGEFDLISSKSWSNRQINNLVMDVARKYGYQGENLSGAIGLLEDRFSLAGDGIYQGSENVGYHISNRSHHLDDFRHHPTPVGLMCSLITQFSPDHGAFFSNRYGENISFSVTPTGDLIGNNFKEKIVAGTVNWAMHLVSDMSGSRKTAGVGMGLPGPMVSVLKEFSALPIINQTQLSELLHELFVKQRFNLQSELAVGIELSRQSLPILLNEIIVRLFYFIRRFKTEYEKTGDLNKIQWDHVLPQNNRTIVRMLTIASGTFVAVDMADAAIVAGLKSLGNGVNFTQTFFLRVNFVGIGRFVVALRADVSMGIKRQKIKNEKIQVYMEQLCLYNAKVFYKQANMWISVQEAGQAILEAYQETEHSVSLLLSTMQSNQKSLENIQHNIDSFKKKNPGVIRDILEDL